MSFPDSSIQQNISGSGNIFTATGDVFVIQKPESATDRQVQGNLRILLNKVRTFWIQGVLEKSIHHAVFINLEKEVRTDSVDHPWGMVLELPDNERHTLPPKTDIIEIFDQSTRALLILGEPGSGKTTTLLDLARKLIGKAEQDISIEPIPVVFNLSSWGNSKSLFDWLTKELSEKYQIPKKIGEAWLEQNRLLPLLDGFDEIAEPHRQNCINSINEFIGAYGLPGMVVCSRITEYTSLPNRLKLNAAICVQPLTDKQVDQYLKTAIGKDLSLKGLLKKDDLLADLARTPLFLSILCLAHRRSPEEIKNLSADSAEEYTQKIFDIYFERVLKRKGGKNPYTPEQVRKTLSWLAKNMVEKSQSVFYIEHLQPSWLSTPEEQIIYYLISRALIWFLMIFLGFLGFTSFSTILMLLITGMIFSLLSPLTVVLNWQTSQNWNTNTKTSNKMKKLKAELSKWGLFIPAQSTLLSFWVYTLSLMGVTGGTVAEYYSATLNAGITAILTFIITFCFLQAMFFIFVAKFRNFLNDALDNSIHAVIMFVAFSVWPTIISPIIGLFLWGFLLLIILWWSEKVFSRFRVWLKFAARFVWVAVFIWSFIINISAGIDQNALKSFLEIETFLYTFGLATSLVTISIKALRGHYKNVADDIKPTESLSWSWKKSLLILVLTIFSLSLFFFSARYQNDVILWDSKSGQEISKLQTAQFVQWNTLYSSDGRRILLLGRKSQVAHLYLHDSLNGKMITDLGVTEKDLNASFNPQGNKLLISDFWCFDVINVCPSHLWNAENGIFIGDLTVNTGKLGGFENPTMYKWTFYSPEFSADGHLVLQQFSISGSNSQQEGYEIWDAETGKPILILYTLNQKSLEVEIEYIALGGGRQLVDMGQIKELIIFDNKLLAQRPIAIASSVGNIERCYWLISSNNIDCSDISIRPKFTSPFTLYIENNQSSSKFVGISQEATFYPFTSNRLTFFFNSDHPLYNVKYWKLNGFGKINIQRNGVDFLIDVFPFSNVITLENPTLPRLVTITDGNNVSLFFFGCFSAFIIVVLFFKGIDTASIERRTLPNHGILLSLQNSLILGELIAVISGFITYILIVLFSNGNEMKQSVFGIALLTGTIVWMIYGGMAVAFHYTLRFILQIRGYLPWKLVPFLDYCADNLVPQKVGGGYIFIHRMLLENLAKKYKD